MCFVKYFYCFVFCGSADTFRYDRQARVLECVGEVAKIFELGHGNANILCEYMGIAEKTVGIA